MTKKDGEDAMQDLRRTMRWITWPFEPRYWLLTGMVLASLLFGWLLYMRPNLWAPLLMILTVTGGLAGLGIRDVIQTKHSILRNYPILAHLRYFFEEIRPEMRQYFFEDDKDGRPFSRDKRAIVYQRAKSVLDKRPFGTVYDPYESHYEWMNHSMAPIDPPHYDFRVMIGEGVCAKPYSSSVLNISGMSFGAISPNAIRAMGRGAKAGGFAQVTGEGSISRYHRETGADIVWQVASGYFGCRAADGRFDPALFEENAAFETVRMIEVKLSQGAKPGHGGVLPKAKITAEIAAARGVGFDKDVVSPPYHSAFSTPIELMLWIAELRRLSGGKPVGLKFCVGHRWQVLALCKAMLETGIRPDYIVIDGSEGGTGAAPLEFVDHVGMPLRDGLNFVHNALVGVGLRDQIALGGSGKIATAFDMVRVFALGADFCHAARAFMFAVGCIQAQSCHTDRCPVGVATQDPIRQRALDPEDKARRVTSYHRHTLEALAETLAAAGLSHPREVDPRFLWRRGGDVGTETFQTLYEPLAPGELLAGTDNPRFKGPWERAQAGSFASAMAF